MSRIMRRRPSPAMVVAFVALGVALAGTANALPGKSRVKKDDIARAAVRAQHIYSNAVRTKHIKARNVTRSKIARRAINSDLVGVDALTGENIVESSLGTVPNASKANGRAVVKIAFVAPPGTGATEVLNLNGLRLVASCAAGNPPPLSVTATTAVSGSVIHSGGNYSNVGVFHSGDETFDVGEVRDILGNAGDDLNGDLSYVRPDGEVVTATYLAERRVGGGCFFGGTAIG